MNDFKNRIKALTGGLFALFFIIIIVSGIYHSENFTYQRLIQSIKDKDVSNFLRIVPSYSDGNAITKEQALVFLRSLDKKDEEELSQFFSDEELFVRKNQDQLFTSKQYLPRARFLTIEGLTEDELYIQINKETFYMEDNQIGPLLPGEYTVELHLENKAFGLSVATFQEDMRQNNQIYKLKEEELYLTDKSFQSSLLENLLTYYTSMNQGISNNFDFSILQYSSVPNTQHIQEEFLEIKDYLSKYKQTIKEVIMNVDSLKIDLKDPYRATFDCYIDLQTEVKFIEELEIKEPLISVPRNAIIQMVHETKEKVWVVEDVDFETFLQNSEDWTNINMLSLKTTSIGNWTNNNQQEII
ncbi:hypothetical protein ACOYX3_17610 [Enterococcus entomosocium]|uniref:hypothetical protein n=1 Tax=Enterococcus entomosocium TaxID=3034352 RepID=UPI003BCEA4C4